MTETAMQEKQELRRPPGLFRSWELAQLLRAGEDYHLEDAGSTIDGTPLVAVYRREPAEVPR